MCEKDNIKYQIMKRVLITYPIRKEAIEELCSKYDVVISDEKGFNRAQVLEMIEDFEVLVPNFGFYTGQEIMDKGKKLELISNYGVGYNNIDVDYATKKGLVVTNTPKSTCEPTAELAFALLLAAGRRLGYYDRKLREPRAIDWGIYGDPGISIFGKTLGIIGMGRIGQAIARRAEASGMSIIYHNRNRLPIEIEERYNAKYVSFEELLTISDYVSLNAPSTPETYKLIGEKELSMMKPMSVFINTARGNMVDEAALAKILKEERIFAAALDVYENEPKIHPELLSLDNVLLAPHAGTKTIEDRDNMAKEMAENIIGFYEGKYKIERVN